MPSNFKYRSGISSAGAYQVSGVPYMSGSNATIAGTNTVSYKVEFPYITQWVTVENRGSNALRIGFSDFGVRGLSGPTPHDKTSYFVLDPVADDDGDSHDHRITLNIRVKDMYLSCDHATNTTTAQIAAGVTMVPREELTGTYDNWSGSAGVG